MISGQATGKRHPRGIILRRVYLQRTLCRFACCPSSAISADRMQLIVRAAANNVDIGRGHDIDLGVLGVLIGDELDTVVDPNPGQLTVDTRG